MANRISRAGRAAMAVALLATAAAPATLSAGPAAAEPTDTPSLPVKVVVLVDESGSLRPEGVAAERTAAALITQTEFSPESELAVVGFASENGRGQSPVDVVCPMTRVDSAPRRQALATCVEDLRIRRVDEGNDTDFVSAFQQAHQLLGDDPADARPKIIFLLTDGVLDVSNSDRYGEVRERRNEVAQKHLDEELAKARERDTQVWPLGFGPEVDRAKLETFAAAGSQRRCNSSAPTPRARVVTGAADVTRALLEAFASARCAALSPEQRASLGSGQTEEFAIRIPAIATDGSIAVTKYDPRISVEYLDPGGKAVPKHGAAGPTTFEVSGEQSAVEVLRVRNPEPGTWRVRLRSPDGVPAQQVSAQVLWRGVVHAAVLVDPPRPRAGEAVTVSVAISTSRGAAEPASLSSLGVQVGIRVSGEGIDQPVDAELRDDGQGADTEAGDGRFTGRVELPGSASGALSFLGTVAGEGIATDERPANTRTLPPGPALYAQLDLPSGTRVPPGSQVSGTLRFTNESGAAVRARLLLTDPDDGTVVTAAPPTMEVPAETGVIERQFVLNVAGTSRRGPATFVLKVVDEADSTVVYGNSLVSLDVNDPPPPLLVRLMWLWLSLAGAALLTLLGVLLARWRSRAARLDTQGLVALLYRDGQQVNFLPAPDHRSREFRFIVRDEHAEARLDRPGPGEPSFAVRRRMDGTFAVRIPIGAVLPLGRDQLLDVPGGDLQLGVRDDRPLTVPVPFEPSSTQDRIPDAYASADQKPMGGEASGGRDGGGDDDTLVW